MSIDLANIAVAVVGTGKMGANHVRVLSMLKGIDPLYIYDDDTQRMKDMQEKFGAIPLSSAEEAAEKVQAVVIATPSKTHASLACMFLEKGIHCLVEKPMAENSEEGQQMLAAAKTGNSLLAIGHIERFNPAVQELNRLIKDKGQIFEIESKRLSFVDDRVMDVDVILDLMIHDLDIICSLVEDEISVVGALCPNSQSKDTLGHACALLSSQSGVAIKSTASRITQNKVRQLNITGAFGYLNLDYSAQSLQLTHKSSSHVIANNKSFVENAALDLSVEKFLIQNREPLMIELTHFIRAVRGQDATIVTGEEGLRVLEIAWKIQKIMQENACQLSKANAA